MFNESGKSIIIHPVANGYVVEIPQSRPSAFIEMEESARRLGGVFKEIMKPDETEVDKLIQESLRSNESAPVKEVVKYDHLHIFPTMEDVLAFLAKPT